MKKTAFIFCLYYLLTGCSQKVVDTGYRVKVGDLIPEFSLPMMDGSIITNEQLKGKVVVLQFTASWCVVCREEMPHLEKEVWQRFKNEDFVLLGVDLKEDKEKVKKFIDQMNISYPIALDLDGSLFDSVTLPKAGVTRNIVLDKQGKIIFLTRLFEEKEFHAMIERIDQELIKDKMAYSE